MKSNENVKELIAKSLDRDPSDLGDLTGKDLFEDLEFHSISIMELISSLEEEFKLEFDEEELIESISSYYALVELVNKSI